MRKCTYCGMPMEDDDLFCTRCGRPAGETAPSGAPEDAEAEWDAAPEREQERAAFGNAVTESMEERVSFGEADPESTKERAALGASARRGGAPESAKEKEAYGNRARRASYGASARRDVYDRAAGEDTEEAGRKRLIVIAAAAIILLVLFGTAVLGLFDIKDVKKEEASAKAQDAQEMASAAGLEEPDALEAQPDAGQNDAQQNDAQQNDAEQAEDSKGQEKSGNRKSTEEVTEKENAAAGLREDFTRDEEEVEENSEWELLEELPSEQEEEPLEQEEPSRPRGTDDSYILPGSDSRYYTKEELRGVDDGTLQMAINELYARHGRRFETESIRSFFEKKSWYNPTVSPEAIDGNEDAYFNEYEKANYMLLIQVRTERTPAEEPERTEMTN